MSIRAPLIKLIVFAIVSILVTALIWSTLGNALRGETQTLSAMVSDGSGLAGGDDVRIAGVRVGRVDAVELVGNSARVRFRLPKEQPVYESTRVVIRYQNLVGQRYLALVPGAGPAKRLPDGATIPISRTEPALDLTVLLNGFAPLFETLSPADINKFSTLIIRVMQGEGATVTSLLSETASLTSRLADRDEVIARVITNLTTLMDTIAARDEQLADLIGQLRRLVSGLVADKDQIGNALDSMGVLTASAAGLLEDAGPSVRSDITKLNTLWGTYAREPNYAAGLRAFPEGLAALSRVQDYGAWISLYVCNLRVEGANIGTSGNSEVCR